MPKPPWILSLLFIVVVGAGCAGVNSPLTVDDLAGEGTNDGSDDASSDKVDLASPPITCGTGLRQCGAMCIPMSACCVPSDCPSQPNGTAQCNMNKCTFTCSSGFKLCNSVCISWNLCCTAGDCPVTTDSSSTTCDMMGLCHIGMCKPGFYDLDGKYANGCECKDAGIAQACSAATDKGALTVGGSTSVTGNLPAMGLADWITVNFSGNGDPSYHPRISFMTNPGNNLRFDVYSNCNGGAQACGEGGNASARVSWEVLYTGGDFSPPAGQGAVQSFMAIPPVGNNGQVYIKVYRVSGTPDCSSYTLSIAN